MQILAKICKKLRINLIVQLWKLCYCRNKPEAGQNSTPQWTFSFTSANW